MTEKKILNTVQFDYKYEFCMDCMILSSTAIKISTLEKFYSRNVLHSELAFSCLKEYINGTLDPSLCQITFPQHTVYNGNLMINFQHALSELKGSSGWNSIYLVADKVVPETIHYVREKSLAQERREAQERRDAQLALEKSRKHYQETNRFPRMDESRRDIIEDTLYPLGRGQMRKMNDTWMHPFVKETVNKNSINDRRHPFVKENVNYNFVDEDTLMHPLTNGMVSCNSHYEDMWRPPLLRKKVDREKPTNHIIEKSIDPPFVGKSVNHSRNKKNSIYDSRSHDSDDSFGANFEFNYSHEPMNLD